jgi:hypothetical protein
MRSYPFYIIFLLCLLIIIVDIVAFYWLFSITQIIPFEFIKILIYSLFWIFTIGLITAILFLKSSINSFNPHRKQLLTSWIYGLVISSLIPKIIFILFSSLIFVTNTFFPDTVSVVTIFLLGLFFGFLPFFIIVYSIFRALYRFKTHKVTVRFKDLEDALDGLTIVQISDLHLGSFNFRFHILDRAIVEINKLNPDFIFFTGDLVNNYAWELKGWSSVLKQLKASKGKYAVLGNHDYGDYSTWKSEKAKQINQEIIHYFFKKIDFKLLLNEADIVSYKNTNIAIVGVENWGIPPFKQYGDLQKALSKVPIGLFKILLSHDPTHWKNQVLKETNISLTLSGHTHGMQAGINIKTKKWSPIKYKYKHWAGLYKIKQQYLYVNRGLGWLGYPGRLGMRPEITYITLKKDN